MKPAHLITIAAMAKMTGREKRAMARTLLRMHAEDRDIGNDTSWLTRFGNRWMVNLSRLRGAHPALFERNYVKREDYEDMAERLADVERKTSETRMKVNSVAAKVRETARRAG